MRCRVSIPLVWRHTAKARRGEAADPRRGTPPRHAPGYARSVSGQSTATAPAGAPARALSRRARCVIQRVARASPGAGSGRLVFDRELVDGAVLAQHPDLEPEARRGGLTEDSVDDLAQPGARDWALRGRGRLQQRAGQLVA
jgi:hypothetical protein